MEMKLLPGEISMVRISLIGRRLNLAVLALVMAWSSPLVAQQTYTWSNGANTNVWSTGSNWVGNPTLTFNNQTDIVFNNASVVNRSNAVAIGAARTIRSITINADYVGTSNATFDIQTRTSIGVGSAALTFAAASGNASFTVAQSTAGTTMVRFGDNAGGNVILSSNLDLAQNNTFLTSGFRFDGPISGAGTINKSGVGEVVFVRSGASWSGGVNINEGNVSIFNHPDAMGTGTWTLGGGANNTSFTMASIFQNVANNSGGLVVAAGAGTRTISNTNAYGAGNTTLNGNVTLNKDATLNIQSFTAGTNDQMTLSETVSGVGGIGKTNTGTLILTGNNTYTGLTTISGGTLSIGSGGTTGSVAGNITNNAALVFDRSNALTYSGTIGGSGSVTKRGAGLLTFTGSNSYSGVTTISGGTLSIGSGATAGTLGSGTVALTGTGGIVFNRSDALAVNNTFTWSGTSTSGGSITNSGAGTLALQGNQTVRSLATTAGAGAVTVSGGTLTLGNASGAQFQSQVFPAAGTTITITSAVAKAANEQSFLYTGGGGIASIGSASSVGYDSLVNTGGTLDIVGSLESTLKGKNLTFQAASGATVIQFSGSLTNSLGNAVGNIRWVSAGDGGFAARTAAATINIGGSGQTLTYGTTSFIASGNTLYFGSPTADNVVTFQNPLNLAGATQTINVVDNPGSAGDAAVLAGVISNGGLTKTGAGRLSLTADNTYTGLTTISSGTLSIGSGGTTGSVAGNITNNAALVFDRSDALTYSGTIGGSGGVTKQGVGALTLAGNSSYAGATAVNVGGLLVDGTLSGVGLTSVASGAWFGGDGSLAGGLTLLSGAQFIFNSSATLDVTGAVALDNNFSVSSLVAANGGAIDWGSIADGTYTLINTTSTFNNILNFGAANAADIGGGRTAYFQNGSLQLVIVPEPGALALAGLGIAAAAWVRRRRA
jgi:fibronectin-binding autotransporter adhesin